MRYIIADPDAHCSSELKRLLDDYEILDCAGIFEAFGSENVWVANGPPDFAFVRMARSEINAFEVANLIKEKNPFSKIIFVSAFDTSAVDAFEFQGDGFLLIPFNEEKVEQLIKRLCS